MLSNLFEANRNGVWDIYDTSLAINYLLQRNFRRDLLNVLKKKKDMYIRIMIYSVGYLL